VLFFAAAGEMVWLIEDEFLATESDRWPNLTDLALAVTAEILRRSGHFLVHAGGVGRESRCLLVAGESGSGKSTLTVRQAMEGWDLYGDDMVIVGRGQAGSWRVYPFSRPIHLTAETARLLGVARPTSRELTVSHKMRCEIGELCKVRQPPTGTIEAVICLRPDWTITEPRLLSPTEALSRLGSTFLSGFNSRSAEADLDDLLEFLAATPVYEASWRTQAAAFETLVSQTSVHADP
jgi:hypothetical protein